MLVDTFFLIVCAGFIVEFFLRGGVCLFVNYFPIAGCRTANMLTF